MEEDEARRYCPKCGGQVRPTAKFCEQCGSQLDEASELEAAPASPQGKIKRKRTFVENFVLIVTLSLVLIFVVLCGPVALSGSTRSPTATRTARPTAAVVKATATQSPAKTPPATLAPTRWPTSTRIPTYTPVAVGRSRGRPMPLGRTVTYADGMELTVLGMIDHDTAAEVVRQSNMFNRDAGEDEKWVLVAVEYGCSTTSGTCRFAEPHYQLVGRRGVAYHVPFVVLPDEYDPSQTLYPGGVAKVTIPFLVKDSDEDFVLVWAHGFLLPTAYFSTEQ